MQPITYSKRADSNKSVVNSWTFSLTRKLFFSEILSIIAICATAQRIIDKTKQHNAMAINNFHSGCLNNFSKKAISNSKKFAFDRDYNNFKKIVRENLNLEI